MEKVSPAHAYADRHEILQEGRNSLRLKASFLLPLAAVLIGLMLAFAWLVHDKTDSDIANSIENTMQGVDTMLEHQQSEHVSMLGAISHVIMHDERLTRALASQDRARLLELAGPIFTRIKEDHKISHLYFHTPERINILRAHRPDHHGDKIDRFTLREAQAKGTHSTGLELGLMGTFTLRHVEPWRNDDGRVIGFLELGMEIDNIFHSIKAFYQTDLYLLVHKRLLDEKQWKDGMRMSGKNPEWGLLPTAVISNINSAQELPDTFVEQVSQQTDGQHSKFRLHYRDHLHEAAPLPIRDVNGRDIGDLWVLIDIQRAIDHGRELATFASSIAALLGALLFILFYRQVNRMEGELQSYHDNLLEVATHDGLTGLYNRKSFDSILASEISRAQRYGRPLSLLLLDVDNFKEVNDTYGHPAGDQVLEELAFDLSRNLRQHDHAARYGGDEFAIILSETSLSNALHLAERIRRSIERHNYIIREETVCKVSLSIGVASCSKRQPCSQESLLHNADQALYLAKYAGRNCVRTHHKNSSANRGL